MSKFYSPSLFIYNTQKKILSIEASFFSIFKRVFRVFFYFILFLNFIKFNILFIYLYIYIILLYGSLLIFTIFKAPNKKDI